MTEQSKPSSTRPDPARLFRRWLALVTLGEGVGFAVAAAGGVAMAASNSPPEALFAAMLGVGAMEGALLGTSQVLALRSLPLPRSYRFAWPALTSLSAALAWAIGMLPVLLPGLDWSSPLTWGAAGVAALVLLATIPLAQLILLRPVLRGSWRWVPANMIGWLLGISWTLAVSPLVDADTPVLETLTWYVVAGILMALTVATATGLCWVRWLRHDDLKLRDASVQLHTSREAEAGG